MSTRCSRAATKLRPRRPFDAAADHLTCNADIEQVELGSTGDNLPRAPATERLEQRADKRVDENLKVLPNRLGIDAAISGDIAEIEEFTVAEG